MQRLILALTTCLLLGACASSVPVVIRNPPQVDVPLSMAVANYKRYEGTPVRWGGDIIAVDNEPKASYIEVLGRNLGSDGYPEGDVSTGRFLVRVDRFADPEVYKKDRKLTVYGTLKGLEKHKIGERLIDYPIVSSQNLYLWPKYQDYPYYYPPFYSSPWYYGYGPYGYPYSPYYGPGRFNYGYGGWGWW